MTSVATINDQKDRIILFPVVILKINSSSNGLLKYWIVKAFINELTYLFVRGRFKAYIDPFIKAGER